MRRFFHIFLIFTISLLGFAHQPDWENHHVLQINREPARAAFIGFEKTPNRPIIKP